MGRGMVYDKISRAREMAENQYGVDIDVVFNIQRTYDVSIFNDISVLSFNKLRKDIKRIMSPYDMNDMDFEGGVRYKKNPISKANWEVICWDTEEDRKMGESYACDKFDSGQVAVETAKNLFYRQNKAAVEVVSLETGFTHFICADGKCDDIGFTGYRKNPALLLISNPRGRKEPSWAYKTHKTGDLIAQYKVKEYPDIAYNVYKWYSRDPSGRNYKVTLVEASGDEYRIGFTSNYLAMIETIAEEGGGLTMYRVKGKLTKAGREMSHNPALLLIHNPKAAKTILLKALESAQSKKYDRAENYMKHFMDRIARHLPRGRFNARELRMNHPELFSLYERTLKLMPI